MICSSALQRAENRVAALGALGVSGATPTGHREEAWLAGACTAIAFLVRHDHGVYIWAAGELCCSSHFHWPRGADASATYSGCVALILLALLRVRAVEWRNRRLCASRSCVHQAEYTGRRSDLRPRFDLVPRAPEAPVINIRWAPPSMRRARARGSRAQPRKARLSPRADVAVSPGRSVIRATCEIDQSAARSKTRRESTARPHKSRASTRRCWGSWGARPVSVVRAGSRRCSSARTPSRGCICCSCGCRWWSSCFSVLGWLRPSWGHHSGQMAAPVVVAAAVLGVATNQGFLRDPLDVRLADASAVTLILTAWLAGRFGPMLSAPAVRCTSRRARWPRSVVAATAMAIAVMAAGATLLSAAELGSLHRALEKTGVAEGPRVMARGARQTISDLKTHPPIEGWLGIRRRAARTERADAIRA